MAGFNPFTEARFTFEGTRFDGAEIFMTLDVPLGEVLDYPDGAGIKLSDQWGWFQKHALISWNLEDRKGAAIPLHAPVEELPRALIVLVMNRWFETASSPSTPLVEPSRGGDS
ncbi:MAG: hypothetical protein HY873_13095 [Chloroflexi bacterium]|nr:hypothetical protein [Chloroflexota bacterium]